MIFLLIQTNSLAVCIGLLYTYYINISKCNNISYDQFNVADKNMPTQPILLKVKLADKNSTPLYCKLFKMSSLETIDT